jgi:hypothetical protein
MSIEEIRVMFNMPGDFTMTPLAEHPGIQPTSTKDFSIRAPLVAMFDRQEQALKMANDVFYQCLGPIPRQLVDPEDKGPDFMDPRAAFQLLDTNYGRLNTEDYKTLKQQLREKFRPSQDDALETLGTHIRIHQRLERGGATMPECDKIEHVKAAFDPCGLFPRVFEKFLEDYPELEDQKFDQLLTIFKSHLKTHPVSETTGTAGYAGLTQSHTQQPAPLTMEDVLTNVAMLMEQHQYALMTTMQGHAPPPNGANPRKLMTTSGGARTGTSPLPRQYCWTHGLCAHNSGGCNERDKPGHQKTATLDNRMGGSNKNC